MKVFWSHRRATFKKVTSVFGLRTLHEYTPKHHTPSIAQNIFFKSIVTSFIDFLFPISDFDIQEDIHVVWAENVFTFAQLFRSRKFIHSILMPKI